jgi:hypothetical protein
MNFRKWTLLVAMMGVLFATVFANDKNESANNRAEFIKERKAYFKENIKPKIDAQRTKLEASISEEDKNEIARLRDQVIKQRLMQNQFMFEAHASRIKGEEFNEDLRTEIRAQHIVIENLFDEAKIIANKYRPEIDDLLKEIKPQRNGKGNPEGRNNGEFENRKGQGHHGSKGPGRGEMMGRGPEHGGMMGRGPRHGGPGELGIAAFLLWDVNRG